MAKTFRFGQESETKTPLVKFRSEFWTFSAKIPKFRPVFFFPKRRRRRGSCHHRLLAAATSSNGDFLLDMQLRGRETFRWQPGGQQPPSSSSSLPAFRLSTFCLDSRVSILKRGFCFSLFFFPSFFFCFFHFAPYKMTTHLFRGHVRFVALTAGPT